MTAPRTRIAFAAIAALGFAFASIEDAHAQRGRPRDVDRLLEHDHAPGEILVRFKDGASEGEREALRGRAGARARREHRIGGARLDHIKVDAVRMKEALAALLASDQVVYAEPNYRRFRSLTPNDPRFTNGELWGLHNTGQSSGTNDADIDAPEAWNVTTGSASVVIAVLDEGMQLTHPDLAPNLWVNPAETPGNGVDDDGNGIVDDIHGANFVPLDSGQSPTGNPSNTTTSEDHGSHVAGTIGARGNDGVGVVGVNWTVRLMSLRFLGPDGGSTAGMVAGIEYAVAKGADAINMSFGGGGFSQAESDAIEAARQAGILVLAAAGNEGVDNEVTPSYPANYDHDNVITVAATDRNDTLASFSNRGALSVDLAAPGVAIVSTVPNSAYASFNGTSMATPHVAGVVGLIRAAYPQATVDAVRARLLYNVDPVPALEGVVATGGRLNAHRALEGDADAPSAVTGLAAAPGSPSFSSLALSWQPAFDDGAAQSGAASAYDVRFSTAPIASEAAFTAATRAKGAPVLAQGAGAQSFAVRGLTHSTTYHLAVRAIDNVGNVGPISTVVATTAPLTTVFAHDFASGMAPFTAQSPWALATNAEGAHATESPNGNYANNLNSSLTSPVIDVSSFAVVSLRLRLSHALESGWDFLHIEVSSNGGSTWSPKAIFDGGRAVEDVLLDVSEMAGAASFRFRLRVTTDGSITDQGVQLFEAEVAAGGSAPVVVAADDFEGGLSGGTGAWTQGSWVTAGSSVNVLTSGGAVGPRHVRLRRGYAYIERGVNLSGQTAATLEVYLRVAGFESADRGYAFGSPDGGTTWFVLRELTSASNGLPYAVHRIDLPASMLNANARISFDVAGNDNGDDFFVDGVRLLAPPAAPANTAPVVAITAPANGATVADGGALAFTATATDAEEGDLAASIAWTSSVDGPLGNGPSISGILSFGAHTITASVVDSEGLPGSASIQVEVVDVTAPTFDAPLPGDLVVEQASTDGAVVTFATPTASDDRDPSPTVVCAPASGSTFAAGATPVTCTATDDAGNQSEVTFTVTVRDTIAPALQLPAPITAELTGPGGAAVAFTVTASDAGTASPSIVASPASGSTFALGATTVDVTATDEAGNVTSGSFTVTVEDTTPPTLAVPGTIVVADQDGSGGEAVAFTVDASDLSGTVTLVLSHASGETFPIGETVVTATATDASGNETSATFSVTVIAQDLTPPSFTFVPADIVAEQQSAGGAVVTFATPTASDTQDPSPTVTVTPASGSLFPAGATTVTATATDAAGNQATASFTVTVRDTTAPVITPPLAFTVEATALVTPVAVPAPSVQDAGDPSPVVTSDAPAAFPLGTTTVTFTATDASNNQSTATVAVTVVDTTAPVITPPADEIALDADGDGSEVVTFAATASDAVWGDVLVSATPASGSAFPVGTTVVTLTATDGAGNTRQATFTVTVQPAVTTRYYFSFANSSVNVPGVGSVADEDIVAWDPASNTWELIFDGSDVGITGDVNGVDRLADGSLLLTFEASTSVGGVGTVTASDIVRFVPTSLGGTTAGTFSLYFDGSDVGLTQSGEALDGIHALPNGDLLLSTTGGFSVAGVSGNDEDVVLFRPTSLGASTAGSFAMHFDGSDVGFNNSASEDLNAISLDGGALLFSTVGSYSASGGSGGSGDVSTFTGTFGPTTSGTAQRILQLGSVSIDALAFR